MANDNDYEYKSDIRTRGKVVSARQGTLIGMPDVLPDPSPKMAGITVFYDGRFQTCDGTSWTSAKLTGVNDLPAGKILVSDENGNLVASDVDATILKDMDFSTEGFQEQIDAIQIQLTELDSSKVDVVEGKGLSTNDFTTAERTKLEGIATGAQVNNIDIITVGGNIIDAVDKVVAIPAIPDSTSDLSNDSGFITGAYVDSALQNVYSKAQVDQQVADLNQRITDIPVPDMRIETRLVQSLSEVQSPEAGIIYLVPLAGEKDNTHEEYMWVEGKWEKVGSTAVILPDDTEITVTQDSTGIIIAGTPLKPASTTLPGYMTVSQVSQLDANAVAVADHTSKLTQVDASLTGIASDVSALQGRATTHETEISGIKASATALDARATNLASDITTLGSEVEAMGVKVDGFETTLGSEIDRVERAIPTSTSELTNDSNFITLGDLPEEVVVPEVSADANGLMTPALLKQVQDNTADIGMNAENIEGMRANVESKASQESLDVLNGTVATLNEQVGSKAEQSDLTVQAERIDALDTAVAEKATQSDLDALQGTVDGIGVTTSGNTITVNGKTANAINSVSASVNSSNQLVVTVNGVGSTAIDLPSGGGGGNSIFVNGYAGQYQGHILTYVEVSGMSTNISFEELEYSCATSPQTFSVTNGTARSSPKITRSGGTTATKNGYGVVCFRDDVIPDLINAITINGSFTGTVRLAVYARDVRIRSSSGASTKYPFLPVAGGVPSYTISFTNSIVTSASADNSTTYYQYYVDTECVGNILQVEYLIDTLSISGSFA